MQILEIFQLFCMFLRIRLCFNYNTNNNNRRYIMFSTHYNIKLDQI